MGEAIFSGVWRKFFKNLYLLGQKMMFCTPFSMKKNKKYISHLSIGRKNWALCQTFPPLFLLVQKIRNCRYYFWFFQIFIFSFKFFVNDQAREYQYLHTSKINLLLTYLLVRKKPFYPIFFTLLAITQKKRAIMYFFKKYLRFFTVSIKRRKS